MDSMEILIKLQDYYNEVKKAENTLKDKKQLIHLKKMKEEYDKKLSEYNSIKSKIDNLEKKYFNIMKEIKGIKVDNKLLEDSLYTNSTGCNVKLINSTQSKIKSQAEKLKELEECKKKVLNEEEELMNLKQNYEEQLENHKNNFYDLKNELIKKLKNAKEQKFKNEKLIKDTRQNVSYDMLKIFDNLNSTKYPAVVSIINETCGGCKMNLSIISMNALKNNKEHKLFYCENCGRIIYIP